MDQGQHFPQNGQVNSFFSHKITSELNLQGILSHQKILIEDLKNTFNWLFERNLWKLNEILGEIILEISL